MGKGTGKEGLLGDSAKEGKGAAQREVGEVRSKTLGAEWTKAFQNGG